MSSVDLLIIGGGYSGTSLLCAVLETLLGNNQISKASTISPREIRILMLDRKGDFGGGIAYGEKVAPEFLLIDRARNIDREDFLIWLRHNRSLWLSQLEEHGSKATMQWLKNHGQAINANFVEELHFPRVIFGDFVRAQLAQNVTQANASKRLSVELGTDEAITLEQDTDGHYRVQLKRLGLVTTRIVALASGLIPRTPKSEFEDCDGYVDDLYKFQLANLTDRIKNALLRQSSGNKTVLVMGSNNTAAEFIYFLGFTREVRSVLDKIVVVSPRGMLPALAEKTDLPPYTCVYLPQIPSEIVPTADNLIEALTREYKNAARLGYTVLDTVGHSLSSFRDALNCLSAAEKKKFVIKYGRPQQDLVRRIPQEYMAAIDKFKKREQLMLLKGEVIRLIKESDKQFTVKVKTTSGVLDMRTAVVVNCTGFGTISYNTDPLINNIRYPNGFLRANETDKGFILSPEFEAYPNLFVLGSLMTGFSLGNTHIWHLECIPRIKQLADSLAATIVQRLHKFGKDGRNVKS
jgi:uncharacterized NAD(P)/FAD-binding protein YdhS